MPVLQTVRSLAIVKLTDYNKFISHRAWVYEYNIYALTGSGSPACILQRLWIQNVQTTCGGSSVYLKKIFSSYNMLSDPWKTSGNKGKIMSIWAAVHFYIQACSEIIHLMSQSTHQMFDRERERESKYQEMLIILHIQGNLLQILLVFEILTL